MSYTVDGGREYVGMIDYLNEGYEWDITAVWRDAKDPKKFWWVDDSGCSCHCPLEYVTEEDMTSGSFFELAEYLQNRNCNDDQDIAAEIVEILIKLR